MKNRVLLPLLIAGLNLIPASRVTAQNLTVLHSFTGSGTNSHSPYGITLSGDTLYGVTFNGSEIFAINTNGTGFAVLHSLAASEGAQAFGTLVLAGNTLYGSAVSGGSATNGTIFSINTNGTGFNVLYNFTPALLAGSGPQLTNSDGAGPWAGLSFRHKTRSRIVSI